MGEYITIEEIKDPEGNVTQEAKDAVTEEV